LVHHQWGIFLKSQNKFSETGTNYEYHFNQFVLTNEIHRRQNMKEPNTVSLLKECDAGTKMAVSTIDGVIDKIKDRKLKRLLEESKQHHEKLGNEIHALLMQHAAQEKDPSPMAKGMSWLKTNMKVGLDSSDSTAADLVVQGCHMGIKTLHKYLNQYEAADPSAKELCNQLIAIEELLCKELYGYL
jgi:hypothetical protein